MFCVCVHELFQSHLFDTTAHDSVLFLFSLQSPKFDVRLSYIIFTDKTQNHKMNFNTQLQHLHITHVTQVGPFLQIYGHKNPSLLQNLSEKILMYLPGLIEAAPATTQLILDQIYLVHNPRTNKYFRCVLLQKRQVNRVTVEFIDYGNEYDVLEENVSWLLLLFPSVFLCLCVLCFVLCLSVRLGALCNVSIKDRNRLSVVVKRLKLKSKFGDLAKMASFCFRRMSGLM